jgi:hypothetical protein
MSSGGQTNFYWAKLLGPTDKHPAQPLALWGFMPMSGRAGNTPLAHYRRRC